MDPLRPFSDLIRALRKSSARRPERSQPGAATGQASAKQPLETAPRTEVGPPSLEAEIATRIRHIGLADPQRAREAFVETVISRELGLGSTPAPQCSEIAHRVAAQIGSHPRLSARLHALLTALARHRRSD